MGKSIAVLQSNYIPWKGYFDIINSVDEFILYDDVQYTKNDWRNRNKIKAKQGSIWLTIPILSKGKHLQLIKDAKVSNIEWAKSHWRSISMSYSKAQYFPEFEKIFKNLYNDCAEERNLSNINYSFIKTICQTIGISTHISWSMDYSLEADNRNERLIELCKKSEASNYLSGPSAKAYLDKEKFSNENIGISFIDYENYPEYQQPYPPFDHFVSIIDLIFNTGQDAPKYMKSFS